MGEDAVAAVKLLAPLVHPVAQHPGVNGGCDFSGAGGLGPIADHAGDNRQGVDDGMDNLLVAAAVQIGDSRPAAAPALTAPQ